MERIVVAITAASSPIIELRTTAASIRARGEACCTTGGMSARVLLLGKPGCHLCEDARAVVAAVTAELGVGWEERSIEGDADLQEQYAELIPVVLVDGVQHDYWRVDADRLRAALRPRRSRPRLGRIGRGAR